MKGNRGNRKVERLASLMRRRNVIDQEIDGIIGRPVGQGSFGEFVAHSVLGVELHGRSNEEGSDGRFPKVAPDPLKSKLVQVKYYTKNDRMLDIRKNDKVDYYLVITAAQLSKPVSPSDHLPWVIGGVYLFDAAALVRQLKQCGIKIGTGTSVRKEYWEDAEIYPRANPMFALTPEQRNMLKLFDKLS